MTTCELWKGLAPSHQVVGSVTAQVTWTTSASIRSHVASKFAISPSRMQVWTGRAVLIVGVEQVTGMQRNLASMARVHCVAWTKR